MQKYKTFSIVIPVFNEERFITKTLDKVVNADAKGLVKEIIVVNDGSTDMTSIILHDYLKNLSAKNVSMKIINKRLNEGKGSAIKDGFIASTGEIVTVQDADLEYDPIEYPRLLESFFVHDADVVYGSRFITERPRRVVYFWHSIGNRVLTFLSNLLTNINITDMETGYKVFKGDLIREIAPTLESKRFGFEPEITSKLAKRKVIMYEVGISYLGRTYEEGKKIGWKDGIEAIKEIFWFNVFSSKQRKQLSILGKHVSRFASYIFDEIRPLFNLPKSKLALCALIVIMVVGSYIRIQGVTWGLNSGGDYHVSPYHDEGHVMNLVFSNTYYLDFGEYEVAKPVYFWRYIGSKVLRGLSVFGVQIQGGENWLLVRGINTFFGIATLYVVYLLGRYMFNSRVGLLAAAFIALFPGHWFMSSLIKGEVLVAFFMPMTLLSAYMMYIRNSIFWYIITGLVIGMGLATKLSYLPGLVGSCLIFLAVLIKNRKHFIETCIKFAVMIAAGIPVFLKLYPYLLCCRTRYFEVLHDPQNAFQRASIENLGFSPSHFMQIWSLFESSKYPFFTIMFSEPISYVFWIGIVVTIGFIIKKMYYFKLPILEVATLGTFILFFALLNQYAGINEDRYIVPLAPFIAIFAAVVFYGDFNFLRTTRKIFGHFVLAYLILFSVIYYIPFAIHPPRVESAMWLNENLKDDESVLVYILSARDRIRFDHEKINEVTIDEVEAGVRPDYMLIYETISYEGRWGNEVLRGDFAKKPYGDVIPGILQNEYEFVIRFGEQPHLFGDKKPETVFTPVYTIYKKK